MKTRKVIVPRMLIKHHLPHPEIYGESIVELLNGMVTDVFTDDKGELFTLTNDLTLIHYMKDNNLPQLHLKLNHDSVELRSVTPSDEFLIMGWLNSRRSESNPLLYQAEDVRQYISHAITFNSHLFICQIEYSPIGLMGFDLIDDKAIIEFKVFDKVPNNHDNIDTAISLIMDYLHSATSIKEILCLVEEKEKEITECLLRAGFIKDEPQNEHSISKSEDLNESVFRKRCLVIDITESEKTILNEFLETYPSKLFELASFDEMIDLQHSIDHSLKVYSRLILTDQIQERDQHDDICVDENGRLTIEDELIQKLDQMMILLEGEDLDVALAYRKLIYPTLAILNKQITLFENRVKYIHSKID